MRHRISILSTGIVLGLLAVSAGSAQAQDVTKPKVNSKTLQKQCLAVAQRDSAKDNSNMAAPAPVVSDSLRAVCDSVNAANPDFKNKVKDDKVKSNYPETNKPVDSMPAMPDTTAMSPATPAAPSTGATPAIPATPATPATPADPSTPKVDASSTPTPQ